MSKIEDITIRRVIDSARIEDVVSKFVRLRKFGSHNLTGLCPFHDDENDGNFIVRPSTLPYGAAGRNGYKCFSCLESGDSVKFLMEHEGLSFIDAIRWLGKEFGVPVDDIPINYTPPPPPPPPKPRDMLTIPIDIVLKCRNLEDDVFVKWLYTLPFNGYQHDHIKQVLNDYLVGHHKEGYTIFWQIDDKQRVRTGKMMKYKSDGHRYKKGETYCAADWVHSRLFKSQDLPQFDIFKQDMKQCLFGQHLMNAWPNATINIVESEKTALIMAIAYPNRHENIWMACGGLTNISRERLQPLIDLGRRIQLFPDKDGIKAWKDKATEIMYDNLGFNTDFLDNYWKPCDGEKADVADIVLRLLKEENT